MIFLLLCLLSPFVAYVFSKRLFRIPSRPKLLRSPYARPGPWHVLKLLAARIFLIWRLVRHPRVLNNYNLKSKNYERCGFVANDIDREWEGPHEVTNREAFDGIFVYGTDNRGTFLKLQLNRRINRQAEVSLLLTLPDRTSYELPGAPDMLVSNTSGNDAFSAAGLKFVVLEPMRKWRVLFNGTARRITKEGESLVHLRMNFIWTAFSRPFEFKREFSRKLMAQGMARELWRGRRDWKNMSEALFDGFDQWGVLNGTFTDFDSGTEKEMYLRGLRQRRWGKHNPTTLHRKLDIMGSSEDGNFFYINATSDSSHLTHEVWGHVFHPSGVLHKLKACDLDLEHLGENGPLPPHFSLRFTAKRYQYHAIIHLDPRNFQLLQGRPWHHRSVLQPCTLTLNARQGRVFIVATNTFHGPCKLDPEISVPFLGPPERPLKSGESEKLVLLLQDEACRFEPLVGGKGSSLALLTHLEATGELGFQVPKGFCVTLAAWKRQTGAGTIREKLEQLQKATHLEQVCAEVSELVKKSPVDDHVADCVKEALLELFGSDLDKKRFAVRSSGIGEDGEVLSAAGQNVTVLGCRGISGVLEGLSQCWASLVAFQSVEYRRQHGEALVPGMGVVVQEMVDSEAAGVIFTVDPVTGNPSRITITANYGLGESVVSGHAEPDTIVLDKGQNGQLKVLEKNVGSKKMRIVLKDNGTEEKDIDDETANRLCLSETSALELGSIALYLEKAYGGPRDLEFAVANDKVYLLQARPVTSLDAWTDFEIRHELDSPILTDEEYSTKANTGEVLPGSMSPLTLSTSVRALELSFQLIMKRRLGRLMEVNPWIPGRYLLQWEGHCSLNMIEFMMRDNEKEVGPTNKAVDMAIFGHLVTTPAMHRVGVHRFGVAGLRMKYGRYKSLLRDLFFNHRRPGRMAAKFSDYNLYAENFSDSSSLFEEISQRLPDLLEISRAHTLTTQASTVLQFIAFMIILDDRSEWNTELYAEVAQLFSSISNVESADVPVALRKLAKSIHDSQQGPEFSKMSLQDASGWLQDHTGEAGSLFRDFLKRHGHRSIKEFDIRTKTWGLDPQGVVGILQSMVANPASFSESSAQESNDNWLDLVKQRKPKVYQALKFFVPRCRNGVACREQTKSMVIRTIHAFRVAYIRFAELLVREGKLPDADLAFFLTHSELEDLVRNSGSPQLVTKAIRRRKLFPQMDSLIFPEISVGVPKPILEAKEELLSGDFELKATPVCAGRVTGTARVVLNLEEAKNIQFGDILITRSTDIGWSPYFPLLAGVVTELGGLISHGAVVAREYGLPCIVGAQRATQLFRSGDKVQLDGAKGILVRVGEETQNDI